MENFYNLIFLILWLLPWLLGGYWIVKVAFRVQPLELLFLGLTAGLFLLVVLSSIVAQVFPFWLTAWLVSGLIGLAGFLLAWRKGVLSFPKPGWSWLIFLFLGGIAYLMARGLAIFDDYAHLPTVSLIAAGYFPPRFAFDPDIPYGYHHFLLLFSAQLIRIAGWEPWMALDAGRALSFALAVVLGGLWGIRVTGQKVGAVINGLILTFLSGARWLLFLIPYPWLEQLSKSILLLGSGMASGDSLAEAMLNNWAIEGGPPLGYPFAFVNGLIQPGILAFNGVNGLMSFTVIFFLLLTARRWRNPLLAGIISAIALAGAYLISEAELPLGLAALGFITVIFWLQEGKVTLPPSLRAWWGVISGSVILAFIQGGTWTELFHQYFQRFVTGSIAQSYLTHTLGFEVSTIPAIVSGHLGVLPLTQIPSLMVALIEIGPLVLAFPFVLVWGYKAFRAKRWYEAILVGQAFLSLAMLWVHYSGSLGVRNSSRLFVFIPITLALAGPLMYRWIKRRSSWLQTITISFAAVALLGGVVIFALQLSAIGNPVTSYFMTGLDEKIYKSKWDQLPRDTLIFDRMPSRAPTVFGRFTYTGNSWYIFKPEWKELVADPDPYKLREAGFTHAYLDKKLWEGMNPHTRLIWEKSCVSEVDRISDRTGDFRWLVEIKGCQ